MEALFIYIFSCVNPARTFEPHVGNTLFGCPNLWARFPLYLIGPVIGAIVAALFIHLHRRIKT
ncbi:MAG: aquaporin [Methanosarcinales archaeon]|nr:aquaporin [Methanosarcinales archaeon]